MKNSILISTIYNGSLDFGGNLVHLNIRNHFTNKYKSDLFIINLSDKFIFYSNNQIRIKKTISLLFNLRNLKLLNNYDQIILDGFLPMFYFFFFRLFYNYNKKIYITVHHNLELNYQSNQIKKYLFSFIQNYTAKLSINNIYFSNNDIIFNKDLINKSFVIIPFSKDYFFGQYSKYNVNLQNKKNYYVIPSNLQFRNNVDSLKLFYKLYRHKFPNVKIYITTPSDIFNRPNFLLRNDEIISFKNRNDYLDFLHFSSLIILPIFKGSGIQIKAIDSYLVNNDVVTSEFIKRSSVLFKNFKTFDDFFSINLFNKSENFNNIKFVDDI